LSILNRTYSTTAGNALKVYQSDAGVATFTNQGSTVLTVAPTLATFGTGIGVGISGSSSGVISIRGQAAAGTYNFNLPITVGTTGQFLVTQGGGSTAMTWGSAVLGTLTNDSAAAGYVGESTESTVLVGSAVSLTSTTAANVTSIALSAGDWDVCGTVLFNNNAATTTTVQAAAVSNTSATLPTAPAGGWAETGGSTLTGPSNSLTVGCHRVSIANATTYYLVVRATFATNTKAAYGHIVARRRR
jgi:hypothetical protein